MIIPVRCFTCGKVLADKYRIIKNLSVRKNYSRELMKTKYCI